MTEWKLVPVEPTEEMLEAVFTVIADWRRANGKVHLKASEMLKARDKHLMRYRAMLAAAPPPTITDEMVERAARVIALQYIEKDEYWRDYEDMTRAALTAAFVDTQS